MNRLALALIALSTLTPSAAQSPASSPTVNVEKLGPQVGQRLPAFRLMDQNGQPHTLGSVMGPKGAMIVFFRSADW